MNNVIIIKEKQSFFVLLIEKYSKFIVLKCGWIKCMREFVQVVGIVNINC